MDQYTLGVDFGSLSARAVICRVRDGAVIAQHETAYPHAVMTEKLPCGTALEAGYQLQHPADYELALRESVRGAISRAQVNKDDIIAMGLDFTGCTILPLGRDLKPLCYQKKFKNHPLAYVNMWKQRNAIREKEEIEALILSHQPEILKNFGGHAAAEMLFCKVLYTIRHDPEVFQAAELFMEAHDYMVLELTGELVRNTSMAAVKAFWDEKTGYPAFFEELHPAFARPEKTFLRGKMCRPFECAGKLLPEMAAELGLKAGIPVAGGHYDGHAALYALNVRGGGEVMMSLGTSSGLVYGDEQFKEVEGAASAMWGTILPQHYSYASGQPAFGDTLAWYVKNAVPADVQKAAAAENMSVHQYLTREADRLSPGESGLIALDWWNGNRSILQNAELTGLMMGMTLTTAAPQMYRALLEGISYGMRAMVDSYREKGFEMKVLCACGGISFKNPLLMQIISDVTNLPVRQSKNVPAPAVGACMLAATAAGAYDTIYDAMAHMHCLDEGMYYPDEKHVQTYEKLYQEYKILHDYFGRGVNPAMKNLRAIAQKARRNREE